MFRWCDFAESSNWLHGQINFTEFNGRSIAEENLRILWNPKFSTVLTRAYRWSVLRATWMQFRTCFLKMHVNVTLPSLYHLRLKWDIPFSVPDKFHQFHIWRYSPFRALASLIRRLHSSLFSALLLHPLIPSSCNASLWTTSAHLLLGLPTGLVV